MEKSNKRTQVVLHVLACIAFLGLPVFTAPPNNDNVLSDIRTYKEIFGCALTIIFFYVNYYFLIPQYYFTKKYVSFGVCVALGFILVTALPNIFFQIDYSGPHHMNEHMHGPFMGGPPHHHRGTISMIFVHAAHNLLQFMMIFFLSLFMKINTRFKTVQKEKISSELSYLKSQINPHFLFNTLNSIYSLSVTRSDKTSGAIVALSGMMRYMLSEADKEKVSLERELEYIRSYIDLQASRFGNTLDLSLTIEGSSEHKQIAPLLLISFIENAFKYGVNPEEPSKISIEINVYGDELMFRITNNKVHIDTADVTQTGIGVENTTSRLNLLYPAKHNISITEDDKEYSVLLILKLT